MSSRQILNPGGRLDVGLFQTMRPKNNERIGFGCEKVTTRNGEARIQLYAKVRTKENLAQRAWNFLTGRTRTRRLAANLAIHEFKKRAEQLPATNDLKFALGRVQWELARSGTQFGDDFKTLADALLRAEAPFRDQHVTSVLKACRREALAFLDDKPAELAKRLRTDDTCIANFKGFLERIEKGTAEHPVDYKDAITFAEKWSLSAAPSTVSLKRNPTINAIVNALIQHGVVEGTQSAVTVNTQIRWQNESTLMVGEEAFVQTDGEPFKGASGLVHRFEGSDESQVAVKSFAACGPDFVDNNRNYGPKVKAAAIKNAIAEAHAHAQATADDPPNIVGFRGAVQKPNGEVLLVQDFAPHGDCQTLLKELDKPGSSNTPKARMNARMLLMADMIKGVHQAHTRGVMHLDVRPPNFFVSEEGHLLLGDFGSSRMQLASRMESPGTNVDYAPPEVIDALGQPGTLTHKVDIWSLGVALYEATENRQKKIPTGSTHAPHEYDLKHPFAPTSPFSGERKDAINAFRVADEESRTTMLELKNENKLKNLILKMLDPDPANRPTADEVLQNPHIRPFADPQTKDEKSTVDSARKLLLTLATRANDEDAPS